MCFNETMPMSDPFHGAPPPAKKARVGGRSASVLERVVQAVVDELRERTLAEFSVPRVAERAGVHTATIYRRWATTGALIAFAAGTLAKRALPVPDTGSLEGDFRVMLGNVRAFLEGPDGTALVAMFFGGGNAPELEEMRQLYWTERVTGRDVMFKRAYLRCDIGDRAHLEELIEMAIGPLYVRRYLSRQPIGDDFIERVVTTVLSAARRSERPTAFSAIPTESPEGNEVQRKEMR